jgi:hypothetical protein
MRAMPVFANYRRFRLTAVFVLLAWVLSLAVSIAHGCTVSDSNHHSRTVLSSLATELSAAAGDHGHNAGNEGDVCEVACDLQSSPLVKEVAGQTTDMTAVALYTQAYLLPVAPIAHAAPPASSSAHLHTHAHSIRTTRLTL